MPIPIKNIYYLLSYAWNKLEPTGPVEVAADDATELLNILSRVLHQAVRALLKRGIDQQYLEHTRELAGVKGKLDYSETLRKNLLLRQKTICRFDEFSADTLTNQILVATLRRLLKSKELDKQLKLQTRALLYHFPNIQYLSIKNNHFRQVQLHRNNQGYAFVLKICELLYQQLLPGEEVGTYRFVDFRRDERQMNQLFEAFIFQFYKIEQPQYKVRREHIHWKLATPDEVAQSHLPLMKTDITLENDRQKIIIDAKYYRDTMNENFGKKKIKSENLYQLFSYLLNQEKDDVKTQSAKGILLYPTTGEEYDLSYEWDNHPMEIRTVDLNQDWPLIRQRLLSLVSAQ